MNEQNLRTPTSEEARAMQLKGAESRKRNTKQRKLMSQIYAEFLSKEYKVKTNEGNKKISGEELVNEAMKKIIARGNNSTVSLMTEIRKATESESALEQIKKEQEKFITKEAEFYQYRLQKRLFDKQKDVFNNNTDKRIAVMCSRRAGKTEDNVDLALKVASVPDSPVLYINLTFENAIKQTFDKVVAEAERVDLKIEKKSKSDGYIQFANGSSILFKGNKDKGEADKLQGFKYRLVIIDEAQSQCNMMYLIDTIITPMLTDYADSQLILTGTPPRRKHTYFEQAFNNKAWKKYHWTMKDNPYIPDVEKEIERVCEEKGVTKESPFIQREYYGQMAYDTEAQVFKGYKTYEEIPDDFVPTHIYGGVDFGFSDYNGIIYLAANVPQKKGYIIYERKFNKSTVEDIINAVRDGLEESKKFALERNKNFDLSNVGIYCDNNEKSIIYELSVTYKLPAFPAYKYDRALGIEQLATYCRTGKILNKKDGIVQDEFEQTIYKRDDLDNITSELDPSYHPDITFALLYASRQYLYDCGDDSGGESSTKETGEW